MEAPSCEGGGDGAVSGVLAVSSSVGVAAIFWACPLTTLSILISLDCHLSITYLPGNMKGLELTGSSADCEAQKPKPDISSPRWAVTAFLVTAGILYTLGKALTTCQQPSMPIIPQHTVPLTANNAPTTWSVAGHADDACAGPTTFSNGGSDVLGCKDTPPTARVSWDVQPEHQGDFVLCIYGKTGCQASPQGFSRNRACARPHSNVMWSYKVVEDEENCLGDAVE
ncbi:hypothetical protein B0H66DRAFT_147588 [Apodospora peruviana]|uniref:Uncharacterized protein n=1 Tax=Apodospora peruviana TaxID=516989 RepID=A0AAE0MB49_9PEZI|nr:hypothetical protein B0H66DRAFT_147588 [Apodospora peruviana]